MACLRAWRARVLYMFACLAWFIKWRACRASKNGVLYKMACLKLLNCFLSVFDHLTYVN